MKMFKFHIDLAIAFIIVKKIEHGIGNVVYDDKLFFIILDWLKHKVYSFRFAQYAETISIRIPS